MLPLMISDSPRNSAHRDDYIESFRRPFLRALEHALEQGEQVVPLLGIDVRTEQLLELVNHEHDAWSAAPERRIQLAIQPIEYVACEAGGLASYRLRSGCGRSGKLDQGRENAR
jgi:hypothetical protein